MKVTFFVKIKDRKALDIVEFYKQDILLLEKLGCEVVIATKYKEIDWSSNLIFIWWWTYAWLPVIISKILRKRTVITGTFNFKAPDSPVDFFRRPFWQRILIKFAIKNADTNILVSKNELKQIKEEWKLKNLEYSPHVIDTDVYSPAINNIAKSEYLFSMIWTGRLNLVRKCLPELIKAIKIIKNDNPTIKLLIGGRRGDGFEYAQAMITDAGLENNITMLGEISVEEKISRLQQCKIYVQPSRFEGFGVAIAEAMACGAAVVSSNAGEVPNVLGDAGIIIDGYAPEKIAIAVNKLMLDDVFRKRLQEKATIRVKENFAFKVRENDFRKILFK